MDGPKKGTRRRGEILEEAILQAAMEELREAGYPHLTMESVATRAGTNKAVLYRRWANKAELVMAALRKYAPKIKMEIPDTGDLRNDLVTYLRGLTEPMRSIGAQTIRGLMMEPLMWNKLRTAMSHVVQSRAESKDKVAAAVEAILKNAELRGEIRLEKLSPRIVSLPWDLLRFELIAGQEISDTTIAEIVDDIFLPLIRIYAQ